MIFKRNKGGWKLMNKSKIIKFVLSGAMLFGVALPMGHASAATVDKPSETVAGPPDGASINWKLTNRYAYWEDGYYVVRRTYTAYPNGKAAMKVSTTIYTDSTERYQIHYSQSTYWL